MRISISLYNQMVAHLRGCLPEEGCGFAVGKNRQVTAIIPIENSLHSTTRYQMNPQGQIDAHLRIEEEDLELLVIFHSHPRSAPYPSPTDLIEFSYPEAYMLIIGFRDDQEDVGLFQIKNGQILETALEIV